LFLFHDFSFEVVVKLGKLNVGLDHLSRLETGKRGGPIDDQIPDADLFCIEAILDYLLDISLFLTTGKAPKDYSTTQKSHLVVLAVDYHFIPGQFYKLAVIPKVYTRLLWHKI
jgi:hypothetical protein